MLELSRLQTFHQSTKNHCPTKKTSHDHAATREHRRPPPTYLGSKDRARKTRPAAKNMLGFEHNTLPSRWNSRIKFPPINRVTGVSLEFAANWIPLNPFNHRQHETKVVIKTFTKLCRINSLISGSSAKNLNATPSDNSVYDHFVVWGQYGVRELNLVATIILQDNNKTQQHG